MNDFNGKVVVITGGSSGIGFALAKAFAAEGARLLLVAHSESHLQDAVRGLQDEGIEAGYRVCDVSSLEQVQALSEHAWETYGQVDVVVNNAGVMLPNCPVVEMPMSDVHALFNVNVFGVWHVASVFGKRMVEQGTPAAIYNTGSENSLFHGVPAGSAYVASKHAVLALTESLREEMPDYIDVGLICPGFVATELIPEEARGLAMDADRFAATAMKQIKAGSFYIVSHAYNIERIDARYQEVRQAYQTYAPRYEGDAEFDVRQLLAQMQVSE